ncbi:MAG: Fic family protein [Bacilli bacterium]|nr:Fic family protein [Bacilli bacterium]
MNIKEASLKWKIPERTIRYYCVQGLIEGAFKGIKSWYIPNNADKPSKGKMNSKPNLLQALKREKDSKLKGGIFHKLQVEMTYNSNHIEGSKLSKDETELIFETKTIGHAKTNLDIDDIIETSNHFKCINYVIDSCKKKLTEKYIKELHFLLKRSTSDEDVSWFNVGEYKKIPNEVGGRDTTNPENVHVEIEKLLFEYNSKKTIKIEDIIEFHVKFERIHPFQDGNGRVGRLIMLKECLKYNIVPILIQDDFKDFYYRGLREWDFEKGYLIDTCLYGQDIVKKYLEYFRIKY